MKKNVCMYEQCDQNQCNCLVVETYSRCNQKLGEFLINIHDEEMAVKYIPEKDVSKDNEVYVMYFVSNSREDLKQMLSILSKKVEKCLERKINAGIKGTVVAKLLMKEFINVNECVIHIPNFFDQEITNDFICSYVGIDEWIQIDKIYSLRKKFNISMRNIDVTEVVKAFNKKINIEYKEK